MPDVRAGTYRGGTEPTTDDVIQHLATKQWGVVARRQLISAGVTERAIHGRLKRGQLLGLHRGVYAVGHRRLRREGTWLAAVLAVPDSVLSHRDAAILHGLRPANHRRIDVTATGQARPTAGTAVHRTRVLDVQDITTVSDIPVTTVARTLVDLAGAVRPDHLAKAIREAEHQRKLDVHAIEDVLERTRGRRGAGHATLKQALAEQASLATTLTRSSLEVSFRRLIQSNGLPKPQTNAQLHGYEVDAVWPAAKLVVELDGYAYHRSPPAFQRDRERDVRLQLAGYRVLRFTHDDVTRRPQDVAAAVRAALAP